MKIMAWNCRGLGSPFIIPQLKESLRLFKPELVFLYETKRQKGFVGSVCRKLGWGDRWYEVDPEERSGGLLLGQSSDVIVHQIHSNSYSIEVEFETTKTKGKIWDIFIYASIKDKVRAKQWQELCEKMKEMGREMDHGRTLMISEIQKRREKRG